MKKNWSANKVLTIWSIYLSLGNGLFFVGIALYYESLGTNKFLLSIILMAIGIIILVKGVLFTKEKIPKTGRIIECKRCPKYYKYCAKCGSELKDGR